MLRLLPHLVAAYAIAYAIGFVSLLTPSGLGVREGAFYLLLAPLLGGGFVTVIALAMRIWTTLGELLAAGVSLLYRERAPVAERLTPSPAMHLRAPDGQAEGRLNGCAAHKAAMRLPLLALIPAGLWPAPLPLDGQSLWYDEGVTATIAQRDLAALTAWTANDIQPPLYYYLVAGWGRLAGWSEWALRLPSAWLGCAGHPAAGCVPAAPVANAALALLAALLAAVHPLLVYYGQEARMYTLLVCLACWPPYLLLRLAAGSGRPAAVAGLCGGGGGGAVHPLLCLVPAGGSGLRLAASISGATQPAWRQRRNRLALLLAGQCRRWSSSTCRGWQTLWPVRVDRSYWLGELKLHEALLDAAISFTSGETMGERTALWLLLSTLLSRW